jgi:porphobilinogen synthase
VSDLAKSSNLPIAVYNVSGEYSMVKAADQNGWINGEEVMVEMLTSFKRAGAKIILTYFAEEMARLLKKV